MRLTLRVMMIECGLSRGDACTVNGESLRRPLVLKERNDCNYTTE